MKLLLDDFRLCVRPGRGLVARFPTSVLVVTAEDGRSSGLERLIEECRHPAASPLTDRLAAVVEANPDTTPAFCALFEDGDALTFFVHGDTQVVLRGAQPVIKMAGRGTAGWTGEVQDRVASIAIGPVAASVVEWSPLGQDEVGDLREGVVPGGAVVLVPRDLSAPGSARPEASRAPEVAPPEVAPAPAFAPPEAPRAPAFAPPEVPRAETLRPAPASPADEPAPAWAQSHAPFIADAPEMVAPPRSAPAPTAVVTVSPTAAPPAAVDGPPAMVWGIHCKRGHFNHPDARYCRMCGTHMVHQRRDPVLGPRPVLGFLVVDDGATYKLDADYVLGRQPDLDIAVAAGEARGLALSDPEDTVSPSHAAIKLEDWNVYLVDLEARYGTHIWRPGTEGWVRLEPGQRVMLEPRSHILLGRRTLVFDSVNRR